MVDRRPETSGFFAGMIVIQFNGISTDRQLLLTVSRKKKKIIVTMALALNHIYFSLPFDENNKKVSIGIIIKNNIRIAHP